MQRLKSVRRADPEHGATVVTFVLLIMVMLGFIGLGVDGAAAFAKRQHVQNGADAAAFALAQEYAPLCKDDKGFALPYAAANVPNESFTTAIDSIDCGDESGVPFVRVVASADQPAFFLKAVGAGSIRIPAAATVEWGSPVAGSAFPLAIADCEFDRALVSGGGVFEGAPIEVWVPSTNEGVGDGGGAAGPSYCAEPAGDYPPGGFGWLKIGGECSGEYVDLGDEDTWIDGIGGNASPDSSICDWSEIVGSTVIIPIFSEATDDDPSAKDYKVARFASVKIVVIQLQNVTGSGGGAAKDERYEVPGYADKCVTAPKDGKWTKHCFYGIFEKYISIDDHWELGPPDPAAETLIVRLKS